jgi:hypothetical protein
MTTVPVRPELAVSAALVCDVEVLPQAATATATRGTATRGKADLSVATTAATNSRIEDVLITALSSLSF